MTKARRLLILSTAFFVFLEEAEAELISQSITVGIKKKKDKKVVVKKER